MDSFGKLINGSADASRGPPKTCCFPPTDSQEFAHLARRMGYRRGGALDAAEELRLDFETHTARQCERSLRSISVGIPCLVPTRASVADLVLSADPAEELRNRILTEAGFSNPGRVLREFAKLGGRGGEAE